MKPIVKLSCFYAVFFAAFCLFSMVLNSQLGALVDTIENLHDHPMAVIRGSLSAARDMVKLARNINEILLISDKLAREREIGSLVVYEKSVRRELELVEARIKGDDGKALVTGALDALKKWQPIRDKILLLAEEGHLHDASLLSRSVGDNRLSDVDGAITKISNYAVGEGMSYHAEGIEKLRKARIILFVTSFIIVLLFLVVAIVIGQTLLRPQRALVEYLTKVTENGLDLSIARNEHTWGELKVPLLAYINAVEQRIIPGCEKANLLQKMIEDVILERKSMMKMTEALESKAGLLNSQSSHLVHVIAPVIDTVSTFTSAAKQIENDLSMMIQITASQQLLIGTIKNSPNAAMMLQIEEQQRIINDYLKNGIGLISRTSLLSQDLAVSLKEISVISEHQGNLGKMIEELRIVLNDITKHLDEVNARVANISETLQCSKNTSPSS